MKEVWFKNKTHGYGWQPASWQGWLVTVLFFVAVVFVAMQIPKKPTYNDILVYSAEFLLLLFFMIVVCIHTGEKPEWRWNGKPIRKKKELDNLDKSPKNSYHKNN